MTATRKDDLGGKRCKPFWARKMQFVLLELPSQPSSSGVYFWRRSGWSGPVDPGPTLTCRSDGSALVTQFQTRRFQRPANYTTKPILRVPAIRYSFMSRNKSQTEFVSIFERILIFSDLNLMLGMRKVFDREKARQGSCSIMSNCSLNRCRSPTTSSNSFPVENFPCNLFG